VPVVALDDVQAGIFDPTQVDFEAHIFAKVTNAAAAVEFIALIADQITTEAQVQPGLPQPDVRLSIGFTCDGLAALGLDPIVLASFPEEFQDGMAGRATILGDNGTSAPATWTGPYAPASLPHLWLMAQADSSDLVTEKVQELSSQAAAGFQVTGVEQAAHFGPQFAPAKEHFGFNDNLGQPGVEGVGQPVYNGQGTLHDGVWNPLPVGCFLLNYANGFGEFESRPSEPLIRQNSTYMVFRKLEQDVASFRTYVAETAGLLGIDEELCAAKFVGRWRSGVPLELSPDHDDPSILRDPATAEAFAFGSDEDGTVVPHFAHIRRANPRDSLGPESIVEMENHRIIRRSTPYGPYLPENDPDDGVPRGLIFRAYNASIRDQFEMIQSEWINSANEAHGLSSDRDAFVGTMDPEGALTPSFTIPLADGSCPTRYGLPRFVTLKGGAYFFLPGIAALKTIARAPTPPPAPPPTLPPSFLAAYTAASSQPGKTPAQIAAAQSMVVLEYQGNPIALGNDLRSSEQTKIFGTPVGFLLSTYPDIMEAFERNDVFSVSGYGQRMSETTGPFMLGMDAGPAYERESSVMRLTAPSSDLATLGPWLEQFAAGTVASVVAAGPAFDLVTAVANRVPLGFIAHYFGVPGPDDPTLMAWLETAGLYIFEFWTSLLPVIKEVATSSALGFATYLQSLIDTRVGEMAAGAPVPDDVLTRLLSLLGPDVTQPPPNPAISLDLYGIRRNLGGFAIGSAVAQSATIAFSMQYLLQAENAAALTTTRAAALDDNDALLTQCMLEAARLASPAPPSLFRTTTQEYIMGRGTPRETTIPAGSVVALYPSAAQTDPDYVENPMDFRPGRAAGDYLMFGEGQHNCFGTALATLELTYTAKALLKLDGLHEVSPLQKGTGVPGSFFPGSYPVAVTSIPSRPG
jgi:Dyp-type peroxidase family